MCLVYYAKLIAGSTTNLAGLELLKNLFPSSVFMLSNRIANVIIVVVRTIAEVVVRPIVVVH